MNIQLACVLVLLPVLLHVLALAVGEVQRMRSWGTEGPQ